MEIHAADFASVGGFDLYFPLARLVVRLEAVAAKSFRSPAEDLDGNRILQRPAAALLLQIPAQLHLVGETSGREDAKEHVHLVAGLSEELLVPVVPDAPRRTLVAQAVGILRLLARVIDPDERDRERDRRNQPDVVEDEEPDQHAAERQEHLPARAYEKLRLPPLDPPDDADYGHAAGEHRNEEHRHAYRADEDRHDIGREAQRAQGEQGELERQAQGLEALGFVRPKQEDQESEKEEGHQERGALEEEDGVDVEQGSQEEVNDRRSILVIPTLHREHGPGFERRFALLEEHLRQRREDHGEIEHLLADCIPGIGALDGEDVEEKPADEGKDRDLLLVPSVVELEAADRSGRGCRFGHFGFRCFHSSISLRANTVPSASSSCMK